MLHNLFIPKEKYNTLLCGRRKAEVCRDETHKYSVGDTLWFWIDDPQDQKRYIEARISHVIRASPTAFPAPPLLQDGCCLSLDNTQQCYLFR